MTVLTPLLRTRTTAVWLLLIVATILSWALGNHHGLAIAILVIAFVKIRFVGLYFMELRGAPPALRVVFETYCLAVLLILSVMYVFA
jgi:Prokaryotic Cytochrome C oxidase subunit IV